MVLRARAAAWFELLVPRASLARAVEALGATGTVQFDPDGPDGPRLDLSDIRTRLGSFRHLREAYGHVWPAPRYHSLRRDVLLEAALDTSLDRLRRWAEAARPAIRAVERLRRLQHDLEGLRDFLDALPAGTALDLGQLAGMDDPLRAALFVLPPDARVPAFATPVVRQEVRTEVRLYLLCVGPRETIADLEQELGARKARAVVLPEWLDGTPPAARRQVAKQLEEVGHRLRKRLDELDAIGRAHGVAEALGEIGRLEWMVDHLSGLAMSEHLAWVTGWTSDRDGAGLRRALAEAGIPAVIDLPAPPEEKVAPTILHNPAWARPFELFVRLLGTPSGRESDPSGLVAVIAPVLFGYMFGDVGQGAVLLLAGLLLRRRLAVMSLLVPGGAMAMVFGVLFGTVFCREDLIPALWTHPIAHPLEVLVPPLFIGAALIALGQAMSALAAGWAGELRGWLRAELGLLVLYLGGVAGALADWALLAVPVGALWFVLGHAWPRRERVPAALASAVGELAEQVLRLIVNTLSFVRVGAFALAHAGLSLAVVSLAEAGGTIAGLLILAVGNLGILALEGLVVSVQTTRLILFEFFIRFVRAEGRPFQPSLPPASPASAGPA